MMEAVIGVATTTCRALYVSCVTVTSLLLRLSRYNHLYFKDDEMEGYRNEVKLVSDRARNQILSCLPGLSRWNLEDCSRVWLCIGYDHPLYSESPQEWSPCSPQRTSVWIRLVIPPVLSASYQSPTQISHPFGKDWKFKVNPWFLQGSWPHQEQSSRKCGVRITQLFSG